ncbi:MAG: hypothetical protein WAK90_13675 [Pseudolabrys sp.]
MNDQNISVASVFLNIFATLVFIFFARTPPQSTAEVVGIALAALGVYGTALVAIAIKKESLRVLSAGLIIIATVIVRTTLQL